MPKFVKFDKNRQNGFKFNCDKKSVRQNFTSAKTREILDKTRKLQARRNSPL